MINLRTGETAQDAATALLREADGSPSRAAARALRLQIADTTNYPFWREVERQIRAKEAR